jgi:serine kinase of HPr protein (carbohydrate metabolism regulator)
MVGTQQTTIHATAVAIGTGAGFGGVLLRGPSGSGKSDLALRLIDAGARLIADDRTILRRNGDEIVLRPPDALRGRLEVRGLGVVPVDHVDPVRLLLIVDLVGAAAVERLPEIGNEKLLGIEVPQLALAPWEISAAAKVRLAVRAAACGILYGLDG